MQQLPEYQKILRDTLVELEPLVQKYSAQDSPLGNENASSLTINFTKTQKHCTERLKTGLPKIMIYGVYNSGKSTLLNALMGEELADVDDIPKTSKITSYHWQGYELLDTPGINAPIEHEKVSLEALAQCQVVLFVVSTAGSFENKAIPEAMRDVVQRGKHLFIVLNDKKGLGLQSPDLGDVQMAVQRNLINVGFSQEEAANFRLCPVNAELALVGRLEHDEDILNASGILELERLAVEEIKRVDGFSIVADLCAYLTKEIDSFSAQLKQLGKTNSGNRMDDFLTVGKEYSEFCKNLEDMIAGECASMSNAIMSCFPSAESATASQTMDPDAIKDKIALVYDITQSKNLFN